MANTLREQGSLDASECFIDATFAVAKSGGAAVGPTKRGKGVKIMGIVDRHGLPLSVSTHAANHHEVTLVQLSFDFYMLEAKPENLVGDRAYDSDPLDEQLRREGIEMIAPLSAPLVGGTLFRLDSMAATHPRPLGIPRRKFPRLRSTRFHPHPAQTILR